MTLKPFAFCLAVFLCALTPGLAQEKDIENDTIKLYQEIEEFSEKTKLTRFLHKLVFRPTGQDTRTNIRRQKSINFRPYHGKIVRNIIIESLDPFGYSVTDTISGPESWVERTGNRLHIRTNEWTIKDLLLIEEGKPLDSLLVRESERLIRRQTYIRSAQITASLVEEETQMQVDSVDVRVRVLDSWSIIPEASFSTSRTRVGLRERNFFGTGHDLRALFTRHFDLGENAYDVRYTVRNFKNTYIGATVGYSSYLDNSFYKGANIERIFYSPFTRWAGGVYVDQQLRKDSLTIDGVEFHPERLRYDTYDVWAGHSFQIFKGSSENDRTTNLITSARMLRVDFKEEPLAAMDPDRFFSSETFLMGSIGIASRQFEQDQYIFNYGIIEDIPVGTVYGITGGLQRKNQRDRLYLGGRVAYGNYFNWGFLSTNIEAGSFISNKTAEQTTLAFQANYFTNLIGIGPFWKMRQFVKPQVVWGNKRSNTIGDRVTLNEHGSILGVYGADFHQLNEMGIPGFRGRLYGTQKFLLTLQTQFYSPWNLWGFRLNPFINYTMAVLGNENQRLTNSKIYNSIGTGFIISNDYLVFDTFQISFAFYPQMPGYGDNIFRANAFNTADFGFQDFEFGKPRTVLYQ
jgi:hypothetical protein